MRRTQPPPNLQRYTVVSDVEHPPVAFLPVRQSIVYRRIKRVDRHRRQRNGPEELCAWPSLVLYVVVVPLGSSSSSPSLPRAERAGLARTRANHHHTTKPYLRLALLSPVRRALQLRITWHPPDSSPRDRGALELSSPPLTLTLTLTPLGAYQPCHVAQDSSLPSLSFHCCHLSTRTMASRSVVYKERETDRYSERDYEEPARRSYTTVKRYQVPESSVRSPVEEDTTTKEKITIRRERSAQPDARREDDYRYSDRTKDSDRNDRGGADDSWNIKITERTRDSDNRDQDDYRYSERFNERDSGPRRDTRDVTYRVVERDDYDDRKSSYDDRKSVVRSEHRGSDHRSDYRSDYRTTDVRYTERDREVVRAPSPPQERVREFRFERERDFSPPQQQQRRRDDDYEVERYVKETDYYAAPSPQPIIIRERAPPAPQPIIIREERRDPAPIIIREERREPQYEFIERREVEEEKQLVKREEPPPPAPVAPPAPPEENYFYERRVIERERPRSRDHRSEIRPKDSASNYSSDDSYEYVRRERTVTDDPRDPNHKRHIAEGMLAGVAGAEILRHHRKSEGRDSGGTGGRLKSAVGGAVVGGIGAEVLSRARSRQRSRAGGSRSRSRSSSYDSRRDRRRKRRGSGSREHSRSKSMSRKQLAGLAGVAAVGALAGYALNKRKNNETVVINDRSPPRRSRSRRRRGSPDDYMDRDMSEDDKHRDPGHRNRRIAQAGLASAAAAGIWEKVRSKSKGAKDRNRSKSRVREAVPVVGAGLGGAALAGLWEKNKANKEAKKDRVIENELGRGRHRRSRSRGRSVPNPIHEERSNVNTRDVLARGDDSVHGHDRGYYSDEEAPGVYNRSRGAGSAGSSPDNRRRRSSRSRSRGKQYAEAGAAAGVGALAAHEYGNNKRNERERQRTSSDHRSAQQDDVLTQTLGRGEDQYYNDGYGPSPGAYSPEPTGYLPPQQDAGYPSQQQGYQAPFFPPPPTGENVYAHNEPYPNQQQQQAAYPQYNPADYAQNGPAATPYGATRGVYGDSEANLGAPYANDTFAGDTRYAEETPRNDERGRGREPPENVSAPVNGSNTTTTTTNPDNNEHEAQDAGTSVHPDAAHEPYPPRTPR